MMLFSWSPRWGNVDRIRPLMRCDGVNAVGDVGVVSLSTYVRCLLLTVVSVSFRIVWSSVCVGKAFPRIFFSMFLTIPTSLPYNPPQAGDLPGMCIHLILCLLKCCCIATSPEKVVACWFAVNELSCFIRYDCCWNGFSHAKERGVSCAKDFPRRNARKNCSAFMSVTNSGCIAAGETTM